MFKRIVSILLVLSLCLSMAPMAYAEENGTQPTEETLAQTEPTLVETTEETTPPTVEETTAPVTEETAEETAVPEESEETTSATEPEETIAEPSEVAPSEEPVPMASSGTCGDNITWTMDDTGTLMISGSGPMWNYDLNRNKSPWYKSTAVKTVIIEAGVTSIGNYTFGRCTDLTSVTVPSSVTVFGNSSFYDCSSLVSITIPDNVTSLGDFCFSDCIQLPEITIPDSVTSLGQACFLGCDSLVNLVIPGSIKTMEKSCFSSSDSLLNVTIENGVTALSESCFMGCSKLASVSIPDSVKTIGNDCFNSCVSLTSITIPNSVTSIGSYCFRVCRSLTEIVIPDSITSISDGCFSGCESLKIVTIPSSVTAMGNSSFASCDSLEEILIPRGVTSIGPACFEYCDVLTTVTIPDTVTSIGDYCFRYCENLRNFTIPGKVTYLGQNCFRGCAALTSITVPNSVTKIETACFYECSGLMHIELPDTITQIGSNAFSYCSSLHSLEIPKGVTSIGPFVFLECNNLKNITFTGDAPNFGAYIFSKITATAYYPGDNASWTEDVRQDYGGDITWVPNASSDQIDFRLFTDYPNLSLPKGKTMYIRAGLFRGEEQLTDVSGITFQVENTSIVKVSSTGIQDNCRYINLTGVGSGTTNVIFNDSTTGEVVTLPVTVYPDNAYSYTLSTLPKVYVDKLFGEDVIACFYNFNGLYIDNYTYSKNSDGSANVSFDAYNENHTHGFAAVYDKDGNLIDGVLIEKYKELNTSLKEIYWDNTGCIIRDIINGSLLSYRQETGCCKKTSIPLTVPKGGYIKISNDPADSFVVAIVNMADMLIALASLWDDGVGYDGNEYLFAKAMTGKLKHRAYYEFTKDGNKVSTELVKNLSKKAIFTEAGFGEFSETVAQNIEGLNLGGLIAETTWEMGWDIGEDSIAYFMGPIGAIMKGLFTIGKGSNIMLQASHMKNSIGIGSIYIQNQGYGTLSAEQVKVESKDFDDSVALNVFSLEYESPALNILKENNPQLYRQFQSDKTYTYNISLMKHGSEIQPASPVTVYIPIPENLKLLADTGFVNVYRGEADGTMTKMDAKLEANCFVFTTDHFSYYILAYVGEGSDTQTTPVYRVYNPYTTETLYVNEDEYRPLVAVGWIDQGIAWYAPKSGTELVYRIYNTYDDYHIYIKNEDEIANLAEGWKVDGVAFFCAGAENSIPIRRMCDPNPAPRTCYHYYTVQQAEIDQKLNEGWNLEGIAWYAAKP